MVRQFEFSRLLFDAYKTDFLNYNERYRRSIGGQMSYSEKESPTVMAAKLFSDGLSADEVRKKLEQDRVVFPSITGVINEFLGKKNISVDALADLSGINRATIYRFMNKERNPSRNALLRIAITLELSLEETQVLLKSGNCSALSASRERDLIIMDGIINRKYFSDINDMLIEKHMTDLNARG